MISEKEVLIIVETKEAVSATSESKEDKERMKVEYADALYSETLIEIIIRHLFAARESKMT